MATAKGYRAINLPIHESNEVFHQVYLKEHNDKRYQGRALFVGCVDVQPDMAAEAVDRFLKALLGRFGDIDQISLNDGSADQARFAHVIFNKKPSLKVALTAPDSDYLETWAEVGKKMGLVTTASSLTKTVAQIRRMFALKEVDPAPLKKKVDAFMSAFEEQEALEKIEHKEAREQVDDDGFQLVASKNKRKREDDEAHKPSQRPRKGKKGGELKNFYRFQIREEKMAALDTLRKRFDEDKQKVAKMKETRKFKPF